MGDYGSDAALNTFAAYNISKMLLLTSLTCTAHTTLACSVSGQGPLSVALVHAEH